MSERALAVDAVVIGGSAGVVQVLLHELLPALPAALAAPVFIVVHVPRDRPTLLPQLFRERSAVPLLEAEDKMPIKPGCVYLAPPDYHLLVDDGPQLALSADEPIQFSRPSIDALFESAADWYGERLLGIVLTGASSDGAQGLRAVRDAGGMAVVEDPDTAATPYMPSAARALVPDATVLSRERIAALLARLPVSKP